MAQIVIGVWFGLLLLGLVFGKSVVMNRASWLTAEESLDHPSPEKRYWHRFWSWCFWYSVSMMASLLAFAIPGFAELANRGVKQVGPLLAFLYPLPLAVLLFWLDRRLVVWSSRHKRNARRRLGLPGYRVRPPADPSARLHVPFATSPPAAVRTSPRRPGPAQDGLVDAIDPHDPELAREFARKHWGAINFALASGDGLAAAQQRQAQFLDELKRQPGPGARQALDAYFEESALHARSATGIAGLQRERAGEQALLRARAARNLRWISWAAVCLVLASLALKACGR